MRRLRRKNINNSNKIIIGISIIFSTIILIIGVTTAYFSQGASEDIGEITATDLTRTLDYKDNNDYARDNLIPVSDTDVVRFAMQNSAMNSYGQEENGNVVSGNSVSSNTVSGNSVDGNNVNNYYYIDDDICRYTDDMNACSVYEFTIKNTSDVVQKINATLTPNPNTFTNLYYMIYEEEQNKLTPSSKLIKKSTHINQTDTSNMFEEVVLTPNQEKTYTLVFYIKAMDYDQTGEDSGKNFGAIVSVNSLTTGYNVTKTYGDTCYDVEKINGGEYDGLFKITKFKGIGTNGVPVAGCRVTPSEDNSEYYTVVVPSNVGEYEISTIGNGSFSPVEIIEVDGELEPTINNRLVKVNNIILSEGIKEIEDTYMSNSDYDIFNAAFYAFGMMAYEEGVNVSITFSPDLEHIGDNSFYMSALNKVEIPATVQNIGNMAFEESFIKELTFVGATDGTSKLKIIGNSAFCNLNISSLTIPSSVQTIGASAFYDSKISSLTIPSSVQTIGASAFSSNNNLETLIFAGALDGTSQLKTIGEGAFSSTKIGRLELPTNIVNIGESAFGNLETSTLEISSSIKSLEWTNVFGNNSNITSLIFVDASDGTNRLRTIGEGVFSDWNISTLILPTGLESIGDYAFKNIKISSLTIPKSVKTIGEGAFYENVNLVDLTFITESDGTSALRYIGKEAFYHTILLYGGAKTLTIPSSVTYIGSNAFYQGDYNVRNGVIRFAGDSTNFDPSWHSGAQVIKQWD